MECQLLIYLPYYENDHWFQNLILEAQPAKHGDFLSKTSIELSYYIFYLCYFQTSSTWNNECLKFFLRKINHYIWTFTPFNVLTLMSSIETYQVTSKLNREKEILGFIPTRDWMLGTKLNKYFHVPGIDSWLGIFNERKFTTIQNYS